MNFQDSFLNGKFDIKRFIILNIKNAWILILGMILGMLVFTGIYYANNIIFNSEKIYRSDAIYNIDFDMDLYGDTIMYYNDFTWNDVIDSDAIAGKAAKKLGINNEIIYNSTFVPTMSDIRIIHVYVDNADPELAGKMQTAIAEAIEEFGSNTAGFLAINKISQTDSYEIQKELFTKRIAVFGMIVGFIIAIILLNYMDIMDSSVYTVADAYLYSYINPIGIYDDNMSDERKKNLENALKLLNKDGLGSLVYLANEPNAGLKNMLKEAGYSGIYNANAENFYAEIENKDNFLLLLDMGNKDGNDIYDHVARIKACGKNIKSVLISAGSKSDTRFLKAYYRKW